MPDMYGDGEYDLAGFCVGIVDNAKLVDGSGIRVGDKIVGLASTGLHSNGFSLARKDPQPKSGLGPDDPFPGADGATVRDVLLAPHPDLCGSGPLPAARPGRARHGPHHRRRLLRQHPARAAQSGGSPHRLRQLGDAPGLPVAARSGRTFLARRSCRSSTAASAMCWCCPKSRWKRPSTASRPSACPPGPSAPSPAAPATANRWSSTSTRPSLVLHPLLKGKARAFPFFWAGDIHERESMAGALPAPQGSAPPGPRARHPPPGVTAAGAGTGTGRARARLEALGTALEATAAALPEQERTGLCRIRDEARALCGRARAAPAAFRKDLLAGGPGPALPAGRHAGLVPLFPALAFRPSATGPRSGTGRVGSCLFLPALLPGSRPAARPSLMQGARRGYRPALSRTLRPFLVRYMDSGPPPV